MNCRFCEMIAKNPERIIYDTKYTFTVLSDPKLMDGHLLVIPKRHIEKFSELDKEERADLFEEVINLQEKIISKLAPGCDISQHHRPFIPDSELKVTHLHVHLRPRELDDELFEKVQINESKVFVEIKEGEWERYKEIFKKIP